MIEVAATLSGDFALFTRPESHPNRMSYLVPTPSALRGALESIYYKPIEFYYEISKIEVLKPIPDELVCVMTNEIKDKTTYKASSGKFVNMNNRTQICNYYLYDVAYVVRANIYIRDSYDPEISLHRREMKIKSEFERRVESGRCFTQPYFGTKECRCDFRPVLPTDKPITLSRDFGIVLYDVFDRWDQPNVTTPANDITGHVSPSYFHAVMKNGVIDVPGINSEELMRVR